MSWFKLETIYKKNSGKNVSNSSEYSKLVRTTYVLTTKNQLSLFTTIFENYIYFISGSTDILFT